MPAKTKEIQKKDFINVSDRDCFLTPAYATKILVPFIPEKVNFIWECASGSGRMANVLKQNGFFVYKTDLNPREGDCGRFNFLTGDIENTYLFNNNGKNMVVTNPPFSLKKEFYERCKSLRISFALLVPADFSGWIIDAFRFDGAQVIVPNRRVDYITPNILANINYTIWTDAEQLSKPEKIKKEFLSKAGFHKGFSFKNIEDVPVAVIRKFSSADFHSYWLTWGMNLPNQQNFVDLTNEMKNDIF